jgi:hypothetical protein
MNRKELKLKLEEQGIPNTWYSLYGENIPDSYVLEGSIFNNKWSIVYFGERGKIENIASFNSEEQACYYFYQLMIDSKSKMKWYFT